MYRTRTSAGIALPRDSPRSRPDWDDHARMSLRARHEQVFGLTRRSRARVSRARGLLPAASRSEGIASVLGWRGSFLKYRCGAAPESHRLPSWDARHKACDARTRATMTVGKRGNWGNFFAANHPSAPRPQRGRRSSLRRTSRGVLSKSASIAMNLDTLPAEPHVMSTRPRTSTRPCVLPRAGDPARASARAHAKPLPRRGS
jgi:hypothetical protein